MALKNHALDGVIAAKAKEEFLRYGYQKGSLHRICKNAGVTTGAVYTRYNGKDDIFRSLVQGVRDEAPNELLEIREYYLRAQEEKTKESFIAALEKEHELYINLLFAHYDECVLLLCRSEGSSVGNELNELINRKSEKTIEFFQSISKESFNFEGIKLIFLEQLEHYKSILAHGYSKKQAIDIMKLVEQFQQAGWERVFDLVA